VVDCINTHVEKIQPDSYWLNKWGAGLGLWLLAWVLVFSDSLFSAVRVWAINDAFNHCFLVLPAVMYFIWQQRGAIFQQPPAFSWLGLLALLMLLFGYALGQAAHVEVLQHIAVFGLIPVLVLALLGWKVVLQIWAPLLFVFFSVPIGEELVPVFQEVTADIALAILRAIDVPVYRNGLYISVPNGSFVVAEACAGIRFFIACVVIGCAFAYLNIGSWWRALLFVLFSVILPIIANGIRAFGIIYIGYSTDMEHAVGADHLIYGWFFFAVIIIVLIAVGHFISNGQRPWRNQITVMDPGWARHWHAKTLFLALLPLLLAVFTKLLLSHNTSIVFDLNAAGLTPITQQQSEQRRWTPRFNKADQLRIGNDPVSGAQYYQALYFSNRADAELVSWSNRLYDVDSWSLRDQFNQSVPGIGRVSVLDLTSVGGQQRLLAYWFVVPNLISSQQSHIKLQQALNTLLFESGGGALVVVNLAYRGERARALNEMETILMQNVQRLSRPESVAVPQLTVEN
jgi:exosortase A